MSPTKNILLPLAILLLALGVAFPLALSAGLVLLGLWAAWVVLQVLAGSDAGPILMAGLIAMAGLALVL